MSLFLSDENRILLLDSIPIRLLFPFLKHSNVGIQRTAPILIGNLCGVDSMSKKNWIISQGVLDVLFPLQNPHSLHQGWGRAASHERQPLPHPLEEGHANGASVLDTVAAELKEGVGIGATHGGERIV
jgi:hypothetical protein